MGAEGAGAGLGAAGAGGGAAGLAATGAGGGEAGLAAGAGGARTATAACASDEIGAAETRIVPVRSIRRGTDTRMQDESSDVDCVAFKRPKKMLLTLHVYR